MDPIKLPKSNTFFIAACMSGLHSYITVGSQNQSGVNTMLLDVGKAMAHNERKTCPLNIFFKMLVGALNAEIMNEQKFVNVRLPANKKTTPFPVNYLAYEISLENYRALLRKLKHLNPELNGYVPVQEDEEAVEFRFMPLNEWESNPDSSLVNTAQHN
jgi:hypothetical protein